MRQHLVGCIGTGILFAVLASSVRAQAIPGAAGAVSFGWRFDSGTLAADAVNAGDGIGAAPARLSAQLLAQTQVGAEGTGWVRLSLAGTQLGGDSAAGTAAVVVIRSLQDGAEQVLDAEALAQWGGTSAYFNGPAVQVELWGNPGTDASRLVIDGGWTGEVTSWASGDDLCGTDERVASSDQRIARLINGSAVCTTWMFDDVNRFFISAGHCAPVDGSVVEFNVPLSTADGVLQHPLPQDQFAIDPASVQRSTIGPSNDWSYFGVLPNSVTGLLPVQQYGGQYFELASAAPPATGQTLRVTGFGQVATGNLKLNYAQTTGTGPYNLLVTNLLRYAVDTTPGNSGSPVVDVSTGKAIGIHYYAGCPSGGNQAVNVANANLRAALAAPLGVCRTGRGLLGGSLWCVGDVANNFGTASNAPEYFAAASKIGRWWRGLAYDPAGGQFFAIDKTMNLYRVTRAGAATLVGVITGPAGPLSGLAYRRDAGRLLAMEPAIGQLWSINPATGAGSTIGAALGGTIIGLDYDDAGQVLYGVERGTGGAALYRIDTASGARTRVGSLAGITTQIADIAFNPADRQIYFINTTTSEVARINPATAAVTAVGGDLGATNGVFGSNYGLAFASSDRVCSSDYNADGQVNLDDLGDFITDFYMTPPIPAGAQANAPTAAGRTVGYSTPCPNAPNAAAPYAADAYRTNGYRVGFSRDGLNACPSTSTALFPNLDNLGEYITAFYEPCP